MNMPIGLKECPECHEVVSSRGFEMHMEQHTGNPAQLEADKVREEAPACEEEKPEKKRYVNPILDDYRKNKEYLSRVKTAGSGNIKDPVLRKFNSRLNSLMQDGVVTIDLEKLMQCRKPEIGLDREYVVFKFNLLNLKKEEVEE